MPGDQKPEKEKIIFEPELATMDNAGIVVPLQQFMLRVTLENGEKREERYDMLYVRGHGVGLHSYQSGKTYIVTLYGLRCLACGLGVNQGDIILSGSAAAQAHMENVVKDVAGVHQIGREDSRG